MGRESLPCEGPRPEGALTCCQGGPVPSLPTGGSSRCRWVLWVVGTRWALDPQAGAAWHRRGWQAPAARPHVCRAPLAPHPLVGTVLGWGLTEGTGTAREPGFPRVIHIPWLRYQMR